jgi:hypothetical protein
MKIKRFLGNHPAPKHFKKIIWALVTFSLIQMISAFFFKFALFPEEIYRGSFIVCAGAIVLYQVLRWPGMGLAIPFILVPNLMLKEINTSIFLWLVVVPSTLLGIFIIGWSDDFVAKIRAPKETR